MRYKLIAVWILLHCLFLSACSPEPSDPSNTCFYYKNATVLYHSENGLLGQQWIDITGGSDDWTQLLSIYLAGPTDHQLVSPFPAGTQLVSFSVYQDTAQVVLSREFADLTGAELTTACACLALTIQSITHCSYVQISAADALLDNQPSITIEPAAISFYDSTQ